MAAGVGDRPRADAALSSLTETVVARGWVEAIGQPTRAGTVALKIQERGSTCTVWVSRAALTRQPVSVHCVVVCRSRHAENSEASPASKIELLRSPVPAAGTPPSWALTLRSSAARGRALLRHRVELAIREYLEQRDCIAVQPPLLTERVSVEAPESLAMPDRNSNSATAMLKQSGWMYVNAMVTALDRVYALSPVIGRQSNLTPAHQVESWVLQAEVAWATHEEIMQWEAGLIGHVAASLLAEPAGAAERWGVEPRNLERWRDALPSISYGEAIKILTRDGLHAAYGCAFTPRERKTLDRQFKTPYFVTELPLALAPLLAVADPKRAGLSRSHWLMPGNGGRELSVGAERETEWLPDGARGRNIAPHALWQSITWFADTRRLGCVPQSGFELDFGRLCQTLLGTADSSADIPPVESPYAVETRT